MRSSNSCRNIKARQLFIPRVILSTASNIYIRSRGLHCEQYFTGSLVNSAILATLSTSRQTITCSVLMDTDESS
eukprot:8146570-Karenia_brevis.AAC.1